MVKIGDGYGGKGDSFTLLGLAAADDAQNSGNLAFDAATSFDAPDVFYAVRSAKFDIKLMARIRCFCLFMVDIGMDGAALTIISRVE